MSFLQRTPFFRLLLPLIAGIVFFQFAGFSAVLASALLFFVFLSVSLNYIFKNPSLQYRFRWLFGFSVYLSIFLIGYVLSEFHGRRSEFRFEGQKGMSYVEIVEAPVVKEKSVLCRVRTLNYTDSLGVIHAAKGNALLYVARDSASEMLRSGECLMLETTFRKPDGVINPEGFDYATYLARQGYGATAYVDTDHWKKADKNTSFSILRLAENVQEKLLNVFKRFGIEGDEYAVLAALTLGSKDALHPELRQNYTTSGGMHILAVSGLHVGVIYLVISFLLRFLDKKPKLRFLKLFFILLFLWSYAFITGLPPSVIRATSMFSLVAVGSALLRRSQIYNTISVAAFLMLLYNSNYLYDVGFQLSFSAVVSIVYFQPLIAKWFYTKNKILKWTWDLTAVSLAAQIGTAPLSVFYFHQFPNYFLLTNLIAIPFATLIIYFAVALFVVSPIPLLSDAVVFLLKLFLKILNGSISFIHDLPLSLSVLSIDVWQLLAVSLTVILLVAYFNYKKYLLLFCALCLTLFVVSADLYRHYRTLQTDRFIVYSDNRQTHLSFINSAKHYYISTDTVSFEKLTAAFALKEKLNDNSPLDNPTWFSNGFAEFRNLRFFLLLDESLRAKYNEQPVEVDFLIIGGRQKQRINEILNCVRPRCIIVDNTISDWYTGSIRRECLAQNIPFYSVAEKGAFVLNFSD